ncbi:unnamed protein product, partial [Rotaria sp. Silwood2]
CRCTIASTTNIVEQLVQQQFRRTIGSTTLSIKSKSNCVLFYSDIIEQFAQQQVNIKFSLKISYILFMYSRTTSSTINIVKRWFQR